jgi:hypothetical protein
VKRAFLAHLMRGGGALSLGLCSIACLMSSCSQDARQNTAGQTAPIIGTTVVLGAGSKAAVTDYQANVKVRYKNDRLVNSARLCQSYRLSVKLMDGDVKTRIDYVDDIEPDLKGTSVLSDSKEIITFDTATGAIKSRTPLAPPAGMPIGDISGRSLFARVDVDKIREDALALDYDVSEDPERSWTVIQAGDGILSKMPGSASTPRSFKAFFDAAAGAMMGSEMVNVDPDGTVITSSQTMIYNEVGGVRVLVGNVLTVHYDLPYTLDVSDSTMPAVPDPATLPEMSLETFRQLESEGKARIDPNARIGDQSDPDYSDIWVTVYEELRTNTLPDSYFRIPEGE